MGRLLLGSCCTRAAGCAGSSMFTQSVLSESVGGNSHVRRTQIVWFNVLLPLRWSTLADIFFLGTYRMRVVTAATIVICLVPAVARGQTYCAPLTDWQSSPGVTYWATTSYCGDYCSAPLASQSNCATVYYAPVTCCPTTCYTPATPSGPGHTLRAPTQTFVTVINSTPRDLSLWVVFLDKTGVEHKSNMLKIPSGAKTQIEKMAESPKMFNDKNLAIAVRSEDGAFLKGSKQGTPINQLFYQDCRDGTIAVGLALH